MGKEKPLSGIGLSWTTSKYCQAPISTKLLSVITRFIKEE